MRPAEVCKFLGITKRTLRKLAWTGQLRWHRSERGRRVYDRGEVLAAGMADGRWRLRIQRRTGADKSMEKRYTTSEAAAILEVAKKTVLRWVRVYRVQLGITEQPSGWARLTRDQIERLASLRGIRPNWPTADKLTLDTTEAAEFLGLSKHQLRALREQYNCDRLHADILEPAVQGAGKRRLYTLAQLEEYARRNPGAVPHARLSPLDKESSPQRHALPRVSSLRTSIPRNEQQDEIVGDGETL